MNRILEIRERIAHYGLELDGHDRAAWDRARDDLEVHAYSDMRYLLDEKQRLESELAAMTRRAEAAEQQLAAAKADVAAAEERCKKLNRLLEAQDE